MLRTPAACTSWSASTPLELGTALQTPIPSQNPGDLAEADELAARLECGNVAINNPDAGVINAPYGGFKDSGTGYEHGPEGLREYLRAKHVRVRYLNRRPQAPVPGTGGRSSPGRRENVMRYVNSIENMSPDECDRSLRFAARERKGQTLRDTYFLVDPQGSPSKNLKMGLTVVYADGKTTGHSHPQHEEVYYVLRGRGRMVVGDSEYGIHTGDALYVPFGVFHTPATPGSCPSSCCGSRGRTRPARVTGGMRTGKHPIGPLRRMRRVACPCFAAGLEANMA